MMDYEQRLLDKLDVLIECALITATIKQKLHKGYDASDDANYRVSIGELRGALEQVRIAALDMADNRLTDALAEH